MPLGIVETFQVRKSIRNFTGQISQEKMAEIEEIVKACNAIESPFGKNTEICITAPGIGLYGAISNEAGWIVLKIPEFAEKEDDFSHYLIDSAFKGSVAVMKLTQIGVGTVWVGGSFNIEKVESRYPGFRIPCVIAFGIEYNKVRIVNNSFKAAKSRSRFDYTYIFYDELAHASLKKQPEGKLGEMLECIRWLPSGINKQSWRISFNTEERKFKIFDYYNLNNGYSPFDIGIMIGGIHFYSQGHYKIDVQDSSEKYPSGGKYVCSITLDESVLRS